MRWKSWKWVVCPRFLQYVCLREPTTVPEIHFPFSFMVITKYMAIHNKDVCPSLPGSQLVTWISSDEWEGSSHDVCTSGSCPERERCPLSLLPFLCPAGLSVDAVVSQSGPKETATPTGWWRNNIEGAWTPSDLAEQSSHTSWDLHSSHLGLCSSTSSTQPLNIPSLPNTQFGTRDGLLP